MGGWLVYEVRLERLPTFSGELTKKVEVTFLWGFRHLSSLWTVMGLLPNFLLTLSKLEQINGLIFSENQQKNFYIRENRSSITDSIISEVKCGDDLLEMVFLNHFFFFFSKTKHVFFQFFFHRGLENLLNIGPSLWSNLPEPIKLNNLCTFIMWKNSL